MRCIHFKSRCLSLVLAFPFLACSADNVRSGQPAQPTGEVKGALGVAITPKKFSDHTIADGKEAFGEFKAIGAIFNQAYSGRNTRNGCRGTGGGR
jgi:hypothetical protein